MIIQPIRFPIRFGFFVHNKTDIPDTDLRKVISKSPMAEHLGCDDGFVFTLVSHEPDNIHIDVTPAIEDKGLLYRIFKCGLIQAQALKGFAETLTQFHKHIGDQTERKAA